MPLRAAGQLNFAYSEENGRLAHLLKATHNSGH
jgi:hypothetical protein